MENEMEADAPVTAHPIPEFMRNGSMERHFGLAGLMVERRVYSLMDKICPAYQGGLWTLYSLSNEGFFMEPPLQGPVRIVVPFGNDFEGEMSSQAAGIVVTLFALSHLSFELHGKHPHECEVVSERYHQLLDFAYGHPEASLICGAID